MPLRSLLLMQNLCYQSNKNWIFRQNERDVCLSKHCALISIATNGKDAKQFLLRSWRCAIVKARHTHANCDNLKSRSCLVLSTVLLVVFLEAGQLNWHFLHGLTTYNFKQHCFLFSCFCFFLSGSMAFFSHLMNDEW